jgi:hypothetical protein
MLLELFPHFQVSVYPVDRFCWCVHKKMIESVNNRILWEMGPKEG